MKTLILTCNTGQGHNSTAASIKEVFLSQGEPCEIADALAFLSTQASKIVDKCFTGIYRHIPKAFDNVYTHTDAHIGSLNAADSMVTVLKPGCKKLYKYITENGFNNIICVHLFPAIMVTVIKEKYGFSGKTALLSTDYTCYPFTEKTNMDLYFLPHKDLAEEFGQVVKDKSRLIPTGIPVKRDFLTAPDKISARKILGLPTDGNIVFIMGGSMGCGPMEDLVLEIAKKTGADTTLLVSCGTNEKLLKSLNKKALTNANIFSFADNIHLVMAAADLFVTKPGGISCTEAGVSGLPTIIIDAVGGCETPNYNFFTKNGFFYGASTTTEAAEMCVKLLSSESCLEKHSHRLRKEFFKDSAMEIFAETTKK